MKDFFYIIKPIPINKYLAKKREMLSYYKEIYAN